MKEKGGGKAEGQHRGQTKEKDEYFISQELNSVGWENCQRLDEIVLRHNYVSAVLRVIYAQDYVERFI